MNKDATELAAKAKEYEELKLKAKKALLDAKKSGELEQIANDMEAAQKEIEEKVHHSRQLRHPCDILTIASVAMCLLSLITSDEQFHLFEAVIRTSSNHTFVSP